MEGLYSKSRQLWASEFYLYTLAIGIVYWHGRGALFIVCVQRHWRHRHNLCSCRRAHDRHTTVEWHLTAGGYPRHRTFCLYKFSKIGYQLVLKEMIIFMYILVSISNDTSAIISDKELAGTIFFGIGGILKILKILALPVNMVRDFSK